MKYLKIIAALALLPAVKPVVAAERPRLVVNIVVSRMTGDELRAYADNFGQRGFRLFLNDGLRCEEGFYNFIPSTPSALATLSTGTVPSLHGIATRKWWDYNSTAENSVAGDNSSSSFNCDYDRYRVSNKNLTAPTVGDRLVEFSPESRVVSIGGEAESAIVMGGIKPTEVWWLDTSRAKWTTSTKYCVDMPVWVKRYNNGKYCRKQLEQTWRLLYDDGRYRNTASTVVCPAASEQTMVEVQGSDIPLRIVSPAGNAIVADFVKEAVIYNRLGADENVDLLNISFDAPRAIEERYGSMSREKEDMYYRLDATLAEMMRFISAQCNGRVLYVLTSDGGSTECRPTEQFNVSQSIFLISSFLSATYGGDNWVLGYSDGNIYLNRMQIFSKGLDLAAVQRQIASFTLQLRGVANAYTSTELLSSGGVGEEAVRVRNSFYPKRSGDIVIVLLPGWTERFGEDDNTKARGGALYDTSAVVPVMFYGTGVRAEVLYERVDIGSVPVSLARIMGIPRPAAATSPVIGTLVEQF